MHLEGPWLSTTGRKRGKVKYKSAEAKRQAEALAKEWEDVKRKHSEPLFNKPKPAAKANKPDNTNTPKTPESKPKSLNSWVTGPVSSKPSQQYTGENVKGIAVMHKSCLQPVFSQQEAIDSATMRR